MDTFENPYCTVASVRKELKLGDDATPSQADLEESIWLASRWLDHYTARDYFYHDHRATALTLGPESRKVIGPHIFLDWPVIEVTEIKKGDTAFTTDQYVTEGGVITRIPSSTHWNPTHPSGLITLKGQFGYRQDGVWTVNEAGDDADQMSNWSLHNTGADLIYWTLEAPAPGNVLVKLWREAAHTNLLAYGGGLTVSNVALTEANNSGITGNVDVNYTVDDTDADNILTPVAPQIDRTQVPFGLPGKINFAAIQIAAVFSGHDRKEVAGLDGNAISVLTNVIPASVFKILGAMEVPNL